MIPFDFVYCRPKTLAEAYGTFSHLQAEGLNPLYYAGGSEIITMCRADSIRPGALIDLKEIPECKILSKAGDRIQIGSVCTLKTIKESKFFPLLTLSAGRIADHTNQCRITLGGNLCGTIIYRETSLPLLLSDATITLYGSDGFLTIPFESVFQKRMQLKPGELIVQLNVPSWALVAPHFHVKRTTNEKNDYPLVSVTALLKENYWRFAFSGLCPYPFRSHKIEAVLNDHSLSIASRAEQVTSLLPQPPHQDVGGSSEYRKFVLRNTVEALLKEAVNG